MLCVMTFAGFFPSLLSSSVVCARATPDIARTLKHQILKIFFIARSLRPAAIHAQPRLPRPTRGSRRGKGGHTPGLRQVRVTISLRPVPGDEARGELRRKRE